MKKLVIVALIAAIITGIAVFQFALSFEKRSDNKTQSVVVATQVIPEGTIVQKEMLEMADVPVEMVHPLAVYNIEDILGRITKDAIEVNEQVLTSRLSSTSQEGDNLAYSIDPNYRGFTILVDEEKGVGGYLNEGDRVDLIAILLTKEGASSQCVVENVTILKIGPLVKGEDVSSYTSVTLSIPAADVTRLTYALGIDAAPKYRLVLRSPADNGLLGKMPFTS